MKYNAIVGQSGGPTAAINATLAGVIYGAKLSHEIDTLYGAFNGIEGMLNENLCNLTELFTDNRDIEILTQTPAAALGSCRVKLPDPESEKGKETFTHLFEVFQKYNIRSFFYIGGNDSMDTVAKLSKAAEFYDYPMQFIGVPKTIDNDLCGTDHTPGYGSAAKFIAASMQEVLRDCAVYTVKAVTIVEIMGRDAGWLTAAAAVPAILSNHAPDLIYLPEVPFDMERFLSDIEENFKTHPDVVIAVSEGIRYADGRYVGEGTQSNVIDIFGHKYLAGTAKALEFAVKERFGCKVRSFDFNLPQRCAAHMLAKADVEEAIGVGKYAVRCADQGISGCMIGYERTDAPYTISYRPVPVSEIANQVKAVPREFINEAGNYVTEACLDYLLPLIQGEYPTIYQNGIPLHFDLKTPNLELNKFKLR
ncbi:MAG: 6-phosphofructokinase [Clostridia bacterium]|nr:6-phosphofructokinase [Clostridia bacterium]